MKTKIFVMIIALAGLALAAAAQQNNYNAETVKLIPEADFLPQANWGTLFYDGSQSDDASRIGVLNEFALGPQEQIFVCNREKYALSILDKNGRVVKTFGKQGYGKGEFVNNPRLEGILNNKLVVVSDAQGRINFFDLQGNFVKLITIDFMPKDIYPLQTGNLIVWGHVPIHGKRSKDVIAELDYASGKYTIIYENTKSNAQANIISIPRGQGMVSYGAPYAIGQKMVRLTADDQIILADNQSTSITIFKKENGKYRESSFPIQASRIKINPEDKQEFYENLKENLVKNKLDVSYAEKALTEGFYPDYLPYFYNVLADAQNKVLFFIFTNEKGEDYAFEAYSPEGKLLGKSEFTIEGYDLLAQKQHFHFANAYLYTLALKHGAAHPLRIIKCRMEEE